MNDKIKIIFMGCPEFAADILSNLFEDDRVEVVAIYTRPPAQNRRGNGYYHHPVGDIALNKYGFSEEHIHWPYSFNNKNDFEIFKSYDCDFVCVAAYGLILPKHILDLHPGKFLNVHASLLPRWRGAAPLMRAILNGDDEVGYSIMQITEKMDEGDYTHQASYWVGDNTSDDLFEKMAPSAAKSLVDVMNEINEGTVQWLSQNDYSNYISYAKKVEKRELWIKLFDEPDYARRKVLASCETAPSKCVISNRSVSVERAVLNSTSVDAGTILLQDNKLLLGFGQDKPSLEIVKIKPDGKNSMDGKSFALGIQNGDYTWKELL